MRFLIINGAVSVLPVIFSKLCAKKANLAYLAQKINFDTINR